MRSDDKIALEQLVRTALKLHNIDRPETRIEEMAIETNRLLAGLASVPSQLDYYDEPSHYAVLMRREAEHG